MNAFLGLMLSSAFLIVVLCCGGCSRTSEGDAETARTRSLEETSRGHLAESNVAKHDLAIQHASIAIEQHRFDDALKILKPLLVEGTGKPEVVFLLAQCEAGQGDLEAAIETLSEIPSTQTESGLAALGQSSEWLIKLGRFDEAESKLREMLRINDEMPLIHRRLAQLLNNQGRRIDAAPHFHALLRLGEVTESELYGMNCFSEPYIHYLDSQLDLEEIAPIRLANARLMLMDMRIHEARDYTEKLCRESPQATWNAAFLGRIYTELHDNDALTKWLASVPTGIEREPEYWYAFGIWHQDQNSHPSAIRCFLEAVLRDETDRNSFLALARSLTLVGRASEAEQAMERYRQLEQANLIIVELKRTKPQLEELIAILNNLRRPTEARAWQRILAKSNFAQSELYTKQGQPASRSSERNLILHSNHDERKRWLLLGLDPLSFPLPDQIEVAQKHNLDRQSDPDREISSLQPTHFKFTDVANRAGLSFRYQASQDGQTEQLFFHETVGGGIAATDFDLDGWVDFYFSQSGGDVSIEDSCLENILFRNLGGRDFKDVSSESGTGDRGFGQGVTAVDINQDGFVDLAIANIGTNVLYINNGDGTFQHHPILSEHAESLAWTTSIACGDLTGDHLPEIVEINYINDPRAYTAICSGVTGAPQCNPQRYQPGRNRFLSLNQNGALQAWTPTGHEEKESYGFAALIANFDQQMGNDLFVANDTDPNHFWVSVPNESGRDKFALKEQADIKGCALGPQGTAQSCMGVTHGDFDHNGFLDLHITNYTDESSDLYLQQTSTLFQNHSVRYGLDTATNAMMGWGTQATDFDNDGWLDLAILNGNLYNHSVDKAPYRMPPQLLRGKANHFELVSPESLGTSYWQQPTLGRTLISADWNGDGRLDLVAGHLDKAVAVLQNDSECGNWLQLEMVGTVSERDGIGVKARILSNDQWMTSWIVGGDGFLASRERVVHFGLGNAQAIEEVEITWPSGLIEKYPPPTVNHRLLAVEGDGTLFERF